MIDPPPRAAIFGASAATRKNGALTLIWNRPSNAASSVSTVEARAAKPAQLTRTSISPPPSATRPPRTGLLPRAPGAGLIPAGDDHRRALLGHRQCGRDTHPGGATGDQSLL